MTNLIMDGVLIIFGILMIVFCKTFAKGTSNFYYNLLHYRFSEKGYQIAFMIGGIASVLLGILFSLGIIKYK